MSTLKLKGSSSGEAEVTVAAAAGTPTITLPTASINLATDGSDGQFLKTDGSGTLSFATPAGYTGEATLKAWAAFDGDGDVNATLTEGNLDSITDHSTGQYTATFTTDFSDDNYMMAGAQNTQGFVGFYDEAGITAGSCKFATLDDDGGYNDSFRVTVGWWR